MKIRWAALVAFALIACGPQPGGTLVKSDKPRLSAATVPASDVKTQASDNTTFAFALYAQLKQAPGNLFFSPYSISSALAMNWDGAKGSTASQMATALSFSMPADRVNPAFNALDAALASRSSDDESKSFELQVANAVWAQQGLPLEPAFLDALAENYGAGVREEAFDSAPDASRADINAWIAQETNGQIPSLLAPDRIKTVTRLVLTNTVTFAAKWATQFDSAMTATAKFQALDGSTPSVPFMSRLVDTRYASGDGWDAFELPYANPDLTLTVIVPQPGRFAEIEAQLDANFLAQVVNAERGMTLQLKFPKFQVSSQIDLAPPLKALGMTEAFVAEEADFSGIDGRRDLRMDDAVQQATVLVDEWGTRASAATASMDVVWLSGMPVTVDRPFFLVLRDLPTGTVLFLGRVVSP